MALAASLWVVTLCTAVFSTYAVQPGQHLNPSVESAQLQSDGAADDETSTVESLGETQKMSRTRGKKWVRKRVLGERICEMCHSVWRQEPEKRHNELLELCQNPDLYDEHLVGLERFDTRWEEKDRIDNEQCFAPFWQNNAIRLMAYAADDTTTQSLCDCIKTFLDACQGKTSNCLNKRVCDRKRCPGLCKGFRESFCSAGSGVTGGSLVAQVETNADVSLREQTLESDWITRKNNWSEGDRSESLDSSLEGKCV